MSTLSEKPVSLTVIVLTLAGTLPFLLTTFAGLYPEGIALLLKRDDDGMRAAEFFARMTALSYGACILSFMAGARWGGMIEGKDHHLNPVIMISAVIPALIAWIAIPLSLFRGNWMSGAMFFMAGCFLMLLAWDAVVGYPAWYYRLRIFASLVATGSLVLLAFAGLTAG